MFDEEEPVKMEVYAKDYTEAKFAERCLDTMIDLLYEKWTKSAHRGYGEPDDDLLLVCRLIDPVGYEETLSNVEDIKREKSVGVGK